MTWSPDQRLVTRDLDREGCGCGPRGHQVLQAVLAAPAVACDSDVPHAALAVRELRRRGLVVAAVGAEGGWSRAGMWVAALTAAGHWHISRVLDVSVHAGGGCGGAWTADQRCSRCGARRPLTDLAARGRLLGMPPGPVRDQEVWASQFVCPLHGRGRADTVLTTKVCGQCGQGLLRTLAPVITNRWPQWDLERA